MQIVNLPAEVIAECVQIHFNELAFQSYLAESKDLHERRNQLAHAFIVNPTQENRAAFENFVASMPGRHGLLEDIRLLQLNPAKIVAAELKRVLGEPLRKAISALQDELTASQIDDEAQASKYGTPVTASAKTQSLMERIDLASGEWRKVNALEAAPAKTISRLGYDCGDIPASADEAITAHRAAHATSDDLSQKLGLGLGIGLEQATKPKRQRLAVEELAGVE